MKDGTQNMIVLFVARAPEKTRSGVGTIGESLGEKLATINPDDIYTKKNFNKISRGV